jgi:predicted transcriptional regulator
MARKFKCVKFYRPKVDLNYSILKIVSVYIALKRFIALISFIYVANIRNNFCTELLKKLLHVQLVRDSGKGVETRLN